MVLRSLNDYKNFDKSGQTQNHMALTLYLVHVHCAVLLVYVCTTTCDVFDSNWNIHRAITRVTRLPACREKLGNKKFDIAMKYAPQQDDQLVPKSHYGGTETQ